MVIGFRKEPSRVAVRSGAPWGRDRAIATFEATVEAGFIFRCGSGVRDEVDRRVEGSRTGTEGRKIFVVAEVWGGRPRGHVLCAWASACSFTYAHPLGGERIWLIEVSETVG
jgi:hypothetical protein